MLAWNLPNNLNFIQSPKKDLINLFLAGVSRRVAVALLTIFSPIYIYGIAKNLNFTWTLSVIFVLCYFLIIYFSKLFSLAVAEDMSRKAGFKKTIKYSALPFILFIPLLILSESYPYLLIPSAVLWGIHAGFFWWGYHGYFIKTGDKEHFGLSIGEFGVLETAALIITPFMGAVVVKEFGFPVLFFLSLIFIILALVLLGRDHDKRQKRDVKFNDVLSIIISHKSISLAYIGSSAEASIYAVVWPVFLFLFFGEVIILGEIVSIATLVASIFALVVGKWVDNQGERRIVSLGSPLITLAWIIKFIDRSFTSFVFADSIWNFGERMVALPLNRLSYKKAVEGKTAMAILFRELTVLFGSVAILIVLIIWLALGGDLVGSFIISAVFSTLPLIAVYKRRLADNS